MADFTRRGPGCDGEGGERGERGKRGHRGHRGATGPTGPAGPNTVGPFSSPAITHKIFANVNGSNETGDGSEENPYRTFQRAVEDLPLDVLPNEFWIVDCTNLGDELLPPNYALPAIDAPFGTELVWSQPNAADYYPFTLFSAVDILAKPRLATLTSGSNNLTAFTILPPDTDTNLMAIKATGQSYVTSEVVGKMIQDGVGLRGVIWHHAPQPGGDILWLTISHAQDVFVVPATVSEPTGFPPGNPPGFPIGVGGFVQIVEQSASLTTQRSPGNIIKGGFTIGGMGSFGLLGFNVQLAPAFAGQLDVQVWGSRMIFIEGGSLDGLVNAHGPGQVILLNEIIHDGLVTTDSTTAAYASLYKNVVFEQFLTPTNYNALGFVLDGCTALGPRLDPFQAVGRGPMMDISLRNGVIMNSVISNYGLLAAEANFPSPFVPASINPAFAVPGHGLYMIAGHGFVDHVKFINAAADAIHFEGSGTLELKSVTGGSGGTVFTDITDTINTGYGLFATDGVQVRISDKVPTGVATPPSLVTGALGEIQSGDNPGIGTTWAAVEGGAQALDNTGPGATLTRVFAKP